MIGRTVLNQLSDKRSLAKLLHEKRIETIAPITYWNKEDALQHRNPPVSLWFLKNVFGTGGKGMVCVANTNLDAYEVPENFVIQAAIQRIMLLQGKKFTTRIYCLIWNKRLYLYKNGFNITHGVKYDQSSTDYSVQIDHAGYQAADGPIKMSQLVR